MKVFCRILLICCFARWSLGSALIQSRGVDPSSSWLGSNAAVVATPQTPRCNPSTSLSPGSVYQSEVVLPILGAQTFLLKIVNSQTAHIIIRGVLRLDDLVEYTTCHESGKINFNLSTKTKRILKRFRTSLGHVAYDEGKDEATLEVRPPLPMPITLLFKRHSHISAMQTY